MSCTLPDLDEYTTPDAGSPAVLDGGADASVTNEGGATSTNEAGPATDSGSDGSAPPPPGCMVDYCQSFDGTLKDFTGDEPLIADHGGMVAVDQGMLHSTVPVHTSGDASSAVAARLFPGTAKSAIIEFDMRIEQGDWGSFVGSASMLSFAFIGENGTSFGNFQLYVSVDGCGVTATVNGGGPFVPSDCTADIPRNKAFHVRFEGNIDPNNGSYKLFFDGAKVGEKSGIVFGVGPTGVLSLGLGIQALNASTPALGATYDNLTVDLP